MVKQVGINLSIIPSDEKPMPSRTEVNGFSTVSCKDYYADHTFHLPQLRAARSLLGPTFLAYYTFLIISSAMMAPGTAGLR